jgi:UTP:GlnB (protein PII) uridylyltransferase
LRDALGRSLAAVDRDFRESAEIASSFLKLLRRRGRAGRALRMMNEVGFLRRYLPEFGRISLLIQHDQYHHYTIDEHTVCDNEASPATTMIEVRAADEPGLAYRIASALADLGLDIVCAKVATEKSDALDVFYVTGAAGTKLAGPAMRAAESAIAERL